jgi:hypothetical protein
LLAIREHPNRYTRSKQSSTDRASWHDSGRRGQVHFPTWRLYAEYLSMVRRERLARQERTRCYGVLARWWACNWNAARAVVDVLAVAAPSAPGLAEQLKARLFGAAPGHLVTDRRR